MGLIDLNDDATKWAKHIFRCRHTLESVEFWEVAPLAPVEEGIDETLTNGNGIYREFTTTWLRYVRRNRTFHITSDWDDLDDVWDTAYFGAVRANFSAVEAHLWADMAQHDALTVSWSRD